MTLGLPIVRTSVDHGTALDLAGAGEIDAGSLRGGRRARLRAGRGAPLSAPCFRAPASASASTSSPTAHYLARIVAAIEPKPRRCHGRDRPGPGRADRRRSPRVVRDAARGRDRPRPRGGAAQRLPAERRRRARGRRARVRLRHARRAAARGRQPALQHLHADPLPRGRVRRAHARLRLHAAEGSRGPHGGRARHAGLRAPVGDAAVPLRDGNAR